MARRSRPFALFLSLVPGWGQIYWGRERLGLTFFTGFALAVFVLVNALWIAVGDWPVFGAPLATGLAALLWVVSFVDMTLRSAPGRVAAEARERDRLFRLGAVAYLTNDLDGATAAFRGMLKLDPKDLDAYFRLACCCRGRGDLRSATAWLRRVKRCDVEDFWSWQVEAEMGAIAKLRVPARSGSGATQPSGTRPGPDAKGTRDAAGSSV